MSDNEHEEDLEYEEGEENYEDGAFREDGDGQEEHPEEGEEEQPEVEPIEPEPEDEPLPQKKEWHGFVRLHLPSSTEPDAALKDARIYFAENDVPLWTRYLVNDDVPYFDAVLQGRDVSDPISEEEMAAAAAEEQNGENEDDEDGENQDEEDEEDEDENPKSRASSKAKSRASSKAKSRGQSRQEADLEDGGEPLPIEFDEDGCLVIEHPFRGNVRFLFSQLLTSQEADHNLGLPSIPVDEEELVFVATVIPKEEADVEDVAWAEEAGLADGEEIPAVGPTKAPNLRSRIMKIPPPADENNEEVEEGAEDGEARREEDDENGEESGNQSRRKSKAEGEDGEDGFAPETLEFRMDALTLSALFCVDGFRRALLKKELPSTHFLEGWLQVFALPTEGTVDQSTHELSAMVSNICDATSDAIHKKKNPDPLPQSKVDEEGNEIAPVVDAKHPPPPPTYVSVNENGLISVPKLRMDLRWTFELEKERPALTATLRYIRLRLLETARIAPSHPNAASLTSPRLVQSYLEFLMVVPRSSLVAWTRPKFDEEEEDVNDIDSILIQPDDDQQQNTPLSHMLGKTLLDLRTREARKKSKKKDLRLSAFAAHKVLLCKRFLERGTMFDPLLVPSYSPKGLAPEEEDSAENAQNSRNSSPLGRTSVESEGTIAAGPWPASMRLYDSDLVALACARFGALETFQEILTRKNKLYRAVDDTVGTYHLLFHSFQHLDRNCATFLVDFAATEVKSIPLLTRRSIVPAIDCIDDLFAPIDKDEHYPSVFAQRYWQVLCKDKAWKDQARSKCPSLYMRVQDEEVKMNALIDEITKNKASGEYVLNQVQSGLMQARDVICPSTMYHAVVSRNVSVIVALAGKGVTGSKKPLHTEQPLIDALLDDDLRRNEERASAPIAARSADDLLASEDSVSDGILSILIALVEAGESLQGVLLSGRRSVSAELADRYGKCRRYKELMKLWAVKEKERSTDPAQKFGILRYLPSNSPNSPVRAR